MKMKKKHKLLSLILAAFMMFSIPAYTYLPIQAAATDSSSAVKSQTKTLTMVKGQKTTIKPPVKMVYSSSNTKVASVTSKGVITACSKGSAVITGTYKKIKWIYKIKVEQPKLNRTALTLTKGSSYQLKVSGTTRNQTWRSGNSSIVSISKSGKVTAKNVGTTTVAARINGVDHKCRITVKAPVTQTVWLSATGSKYHKIPNCGRMNPAKARQVDLSYAKSHGFTPCSNCF